MSWGQSRNTAATVPPEASGGRGSVLRQLSESVVVLAVAVLSFRAFAAEGYLISTGSMAPSLLGYHRQVTCPSCRYQFAAGMIIRDESPRPGEAQAQDLYADDVHSHTVAACPLCGYDHIEVDELPRNEGDQLMVHKHAYQFRDPHRWEVIVFRNPFDPAQAYVKRVVGLPGETVSIRDGDVYIDGEIQPKSLAALRSMRILIDDHAFAPDDESDDWQPRWQSAEDSGWEAVADEFVFTPPAEHSESDSPPPPEALTFRHWIAAGGHHVTSVPLDRWPAGIGPPPVAGSSLSYDEAVQSLSCIGVLEPATCERWQSASNDPAFHQALEHLAAASHEAPVVDDYGYNRLGDGNSGFVVRDLMLSLRLNAVDRDGLWTVEIDDGRRGYSVEFDFARGEAALFGDDSDRSLEVVPLPPDMINAPMEVELSLMDRQALVAVNGKLLFEPVTADSPGRNEPAPRQPLRISAADGRFRMSELRVYRDIYYTPKADDRRSFDLEGDEFFVLGDNSPVSLDSRCWEEPAVHRRDLIGKPLVVHLPSRQGKLTLFGETRYVRIPDFSRVRYIR